MAIAAFSISCGNGSGSDSDSPSAVTHTVTMAAISFTPPTLTIALGDMVTWVNEDPFPHNAKATGGASDSRDLDPGESFTYTPVATGDYSYVCTLHPTMRAVVQVKERLPQDKSPQ
jgi:plastocyanin